MIGRKQSLEPFPPILSHYIVINCRVVVVQSSFLVLAPLELLPSCAMLLPSKQREQLEGR